MLDLFREEVRGNLLVLNQGLVALEQNPDDLRRIEPLMRAAHSVKGAARTLAIDPAVLVAHSLEECLVLAQNGRLQLTGADVDVLLEAVDTLGQMGEAVGPGFSAWYAEHTDRVAHLLERLHATAQGKHEEPSIARRASKGEAPRAGDLGKSEPLTDRENLEEDSPPDPVEPEETEDAPEEQDESRQPLLELFHTELIGHGQTLREGLGVLEKDTGAAPALESLLRSARWVRSAAHIVHIDRAVQLARAIEGCLLAAQSNRQAPSSQDLAALGRAVDLLSALGEAAAGPGLSTWLLDHEEEIVALLTQLASAAQVKVVREPPPVRSAELVPAPAPENRDGPAASPRLPVTTQEAEQVVRVTAQSLTRLMSLAGEALVQARWLQAFPKLLLRLKRRQARLVDSIDELGQSLRGESDRSLLASVREELSQCQGELDDRIGEFEDHAREADDLNSRLYREVLASRMRPFADGAHGFPRLVRDLARQLGKKVRFDVVGESVEVDRDILEKLEAPLGHLLRNALDHGLETPAERQAAGKPETGSLRIEARHSAGMLSIQVRDDGRGISSERIRRKVIERKMASPEMAAGLREDELLEFLFLPGFSTAEQVTDVSGAASVSTWFTAWSAPLAARCALPRSQAAGCVPSAIASHAFRDPGRAGRDRR